MNIVGLDFGTTYSVIAEHMNDSSNHEMRIARLGEQKHSDYYDSLVVVDNDTGLSYYGSYARNHKVNSGSKTYLGFKLMLSEKDPQILASEGYTESITPVTITTEFVRDIIGKYLRNKQGTIDSLVVGIPEIWTENFDDSTHNNQPLSRQILHDIIDGIDEVNSFDFITEPEAACVYYVFNYQKTMGIKYTGYVLIVDYGGGTLDISLCSVCWEGEQAKIKVEKHTGAGANERGKIGDAGLAFMEEVARLALLEGGVSEEIINQYKDAFTACVYEVENLFMTFSGLGIKDKFYSDFRDKSQSISLKNLRNDSTRFIAEVQFLPLDEQKKVVPLEKNSFVVTNAMVAKAFLKTIRPILMDQLNSFISYMNENNISWGLNAEGFKIQLIGGFSNFLLVEQEISRILIPGTALDKSDDRRYMGQLPRNERDRAVAYGAALKAAGRVSIVPSTKYSIGISLYLTHSEQLIAWALQAGEELEFDKVYLFKWNGCVVNLLGNGIAQLEFMRSDGERFTRPLAQLYRNALRDIGKAQYILGLSMNRYGKLSFHWWEILDEGKYERALPNVEDKIAKGEKLACLGEEHIIEMDTIHNIAGI